MDYEDIEWEDNEGNISSITNSTNQNDSFTFDENSLEFEDDQDDNKNNNQSLDTSIIENNENENETDDEEAIEFEIDTNIYKKGKEKKKVVRTVDTKEKRNFLSIHKSVLALYLASFKFTITTLSNEYLNSILLSLIPLDLINKYSNIYSIDNKPLNVTTTTSTRLKSKNPPTQQECINEIINWYTSTFELDESILNISEKVEPTKRKSKSTKKESPKNQDDNNKNLLYDQILNQINQKRLSKKLYVEVFYMVCNLFSFECRLVRPLLLPPPVPVTPSKLKKIVSSTLSPTSAVSKKSKSLPNISIRLNQDENDKVKVLKTTTTTTKTTASSVKKKVDQAIESKNSRSSNKSKRSNGKSNSIIRGGKISRSKKNFSDSESDSESEEDYYDEDEDTKEKNKKKKKKPLLSFDSTDDENDKEEDSGDKMITRPVTKRQLAIQKLNSPSKSPKKRNLNDTTDTESSENEDKKKAKRSSSTPISRRKSSSIINSASKPNNSFTNSSGSNSISSKDKIEIENWVEIFNHDEKRWISIDIVNKEIDKSSEFEKYENPFSYVVGYNQYLFRDITTRYTNNYIGSSLKRLPIAQSNYWNQLICNIFNQDDGDSSIIHVEDNGCGNNNNNNNNEDIGLGLTNINNKMLSNEKRIQLEEIIKFERKEKIEKESKLEFPISFAQFKTHPVYILEKDISKYSAPDPNEKAIGLFKNEHKIYHRDQIKALHTSDKWVQYGYSVRDGEQPVKVVKGRSKSNPTSLLYGDWQIDPYKPPVIGSDGIVPVNSFGNVYLFKPEMLPIGGVHLKGTGYARVARKLGISIAPAIIGWDLGYRRSYPLVDGIIVSKENSKRLYDAWLADSTNRINESRIKKEEEIKLRWRRFMKNLLINEYIKKTYKNTDNNENTLNNLKPSTQQENQLNNDNDNDNDNSVKIQDIQKIVNDQKEIDNLNYLKNKLNKFNDNYRNNNNNISDNSNSSNNNVNKLKIKKSTVNNKKKSNNNIKKSSPRKKKQVLSFDSTDEEEEEEEEVQEDSDKDSTDNEESSNSNQENGSQYQIIKNELVSSKPITKRQLALKQELERKQLESQQNKSSKSSKS